MLPGVFVSGAGLSKAGPPRTSSFGPRCVCVCVSNSGLCEGNSGTPAGANLIGLRPRWPAPAGGPLGNGGGGDGRGPPGGRHPLAAGGREVSGAPGGRSDCHGPCGERPSVSPHRSAEGHVWRMSGRWRGRHRERAPRPRDAPVRCGGRDAVKASTTTSPQPGLHLGLEIGMPPWCRHGGKGMRRLRTSMSRQGHPMSGPKGNNPAHPHHNARKHCRAVSPPDASGSTLDREDLLLPKFARISTTNFGVN